MPIYEFKCKLCKYEFEKLCDHSLDPAKFPRCPQCNGPTNKLISLSAFHLKGTGWGADNYTSKKGDTANDGT
jgi:putative FmdB family regulatory protein